MKYLIIALGFILCAALPGLAQAQSSCNPTTNHVQYSKSQATNLLSSSVACYPAAATQPNFTNQEAHYAGGTLGDYKRGPAGPGVNDPTLGNIGGWSIDAAGKVTYAYTGGGNFSYIIFGFNVANPPGATYDFCTAVGATPIRIRVAKSSVGPC